MNKLLLGTTALVVAGFALASSPVSAQAPASQPITSSNFSIAIGGFARQFVQYQSQENLAPALRDGMVDTMMDNRLNLTFRAALPNGMSAGATWNINPHANTATGNSITRRAFNFIEGGFGQVQIGMTENVANQMHQNSFQGWAAGGLDDSNALAWATNRVGVTSAAPQNSNPWTGMDTDGIANKIIYFTPRIEGFQFGVNYTPEMSAGRNGLATTNTQYINGWSSAVNFVRTFDGLAVRASAGYLTFEKPSGVLLTPALQQSTKRAESWNAGLGFRYAGIDVGGSYSKVNNWRVIAAGTTTAAAAALADGLRNNNGDVWEAGIGYIFGPASVSINTNHSKNDHSTVTAGVTTPQALGKDKIAVYGVQGSYLLAPGVTVGVTVFTAKYTEGTPNTVTAQNANFFKPGDQTSRARGVFSGLTLAF